jgi:hypothetical protein
LGCEHAHDFGASSAIPSDDQELRFCHAVAQARRVPSLFFLGPGSQPARRLRQDCNVFAKVLSHDLEDWRLPCPGPTGENNEPWAM